MKIRSITFFSDLKQESNKDHLNDLGKAASEARSQVQDLGLEVQSLRLASQSFSKLSAGLDAEQTLSLAMQIDEQAKAAGFDYLSLGPVSAGKSEDLAKLAKVIRESELIFLSMHLFDDTHEIDPHYLARCAEIILDASTVESNGFANLKLAALANVGPGSPFFPAAYHGGGKAAFAFAPQAADLAVDSFEEAITISEASQRLSESIEKRTRALEEIGHHIAEKYDLSFLGTDFSLAPYPDDRESLGQAFENMGVPKSGMQGSLIASAILTSAIQNANFKRTGFNGLLLPPLEDSILAQRASEGLLSINHLLLLSAVCGTGLDTIPLPGDVSAASLTAILMDLAALAIRLDKPLTARLMPIPGKQAGEQTNFEFEFFANSRILAVDEEGLRGALKSSSPFKLSPR